MNLPYSTVQDLVLDLRNKHFKGFNPLPFTWHSDPNPEMAETWWLCSDRVNPAFAYGKIVATLREGWVKPGSVFVGFNVEKGILDPKHKGEGYVLKKNWLWNEFVRDSASLLPTKLAEAADARAAPLEVVIACGTEPQRGGRTEVGDLAQFEGKDFELNLVNSDVRNGFLKGVITAANCAVLAAELAKLNPPALAYQWVDLMIGSHFTMNPAGPDDLAAAAAMLEPFKGWLRLGK